MPLCLSSRLCAFVPLCLPLVSFLSPTRNPVCLPPFVPLCLCAFVPFFVPLCLCAFVPFFVPLCLSSCLCAFPQCLPSFEGETRGNGNCLRIRFSLRSHTNRLTHLRGGINAIAAFLERRPQPGQGEFHPPNHPRELSGFHFGARLTKQEPLR